MHGPAALSLDYPVVTDRAGFFQKPEAAGGGGEQGANLAKLTNDEHETSSVHVSPAGRIESLVFVFVGQPLLNNNKNNVKCKS